MADQSVSTIAAAPSPAVSSTSLQIAVLAALAAMGTLATNILLPSLPQMAASLTVSTAEVTSAITVFLAMFALGQLVVGPISDRYGRRWPVLTGFAIFFVGSVWCGLATDLPSLLTGRVIQAAGACATSVLSRAIARDLFSGAALARAMALIMIAMAAAPGSPVRTIVLPDCDPISSPPPAFLRCSAARSTTCSAGDRNSPLSDCSQRLAHLLMARFSVRPTVPRGLRLNRGLSSERIWDCRPIAASLFRPPPSASSWAGCSRFFPLRQAS